MPEAKQQVRTYVTNYNCDKCGSPMKFTGMIGGWSDHEHKCTNCGTARWFDKKYPDVTYEPIIKE